jgi:hypothetical protein
VVIGEAMLTMNTQAQKERIAAEANRILKPGGLYGIHELAIGPTGISSAREAEIDQALSSAIHVGARPLALERWRKLMADAGLEVVGSGTAPMHLLEPKRMIQDEGLLGTLNIVKNVALNRAARKRILHMRRTFKRYREHLCAVFLVARKPPAN